MLDPEDELFDRKLASHLVSLYYKGSEQQEQEMLVRCLMMLRYFIETSCSLSVVVLAVADLAVSYLGPLLLWARWAGPDGIEA